MLTKEKRIVFFTIITIAACFFSGLLKSGNLENVNTYMHETTNSQVTTIVNTSYPAQVQFVYGSKKKLISDF